MANDDLQVEIDEYIEAPPAEAFEYLTNPDHHPLGDRLGDGPVELGDEIERDTPSRITWRTTTADGETRRAGTVEIEVSPSGEGSRVRVTHRIGSPVARAALALAA